jgi:transposase
MTLHPRDLWIIPSETARIARAAMPKGNVYMMMYEQLGQLYVDRDFQSLFPAECGQSAISPAKLALITIMQFAEGLSDRQTAEAVRTRIDWKYALGLELTDAGFDYSVLSEFRDSEALLRSADRLITTGQESQLLEIMLSQFKQKKLLKSRGRQRTDSSHVLAAIRRLNRLECVGETLRHALNDLAKAAPQWLKALVTQDWFDLYGARFEQYRLPTQKAEQEQRLSRSDGDKLY